MVRSGTALAKLGAVRQRRNGARRLAVAKQGMDARWLGAVRRCGGGGLGGQATSSPGTAMLGIGTAVTGDAIVVQGKARRAAAQRGPSHVLHRLGQVTGRQGEARQRAAMTGKGTAQRGAGGAGLGAARVCSGIGAVRQRGDERWHSAARYGAGEAARGNARAKPGGARQWQRQIWTSGGQVSLGHATAGQREARAL